MKKKSILVKVIPIVVAAALIVGLTVFSSAVWDQEQAVHIDPVGIESSTLAIGTHLIHLSALTDELYEIADASAGDSGQERIYYKSELAEGAWFDITTASTLADITTGGTPVSNAAIAELYFEYHTRSDGNTYDLRTGATVNIYDIRNPYDLETWDELFPLKTQYDLITEMQSDSAAGQQKIARIEEIFSLEVTNSITIECDNWLAALQRYYNVLSENGGGEAEMSVVQGVMSAVDATRRAEVFQIVEDAMNLYTQELQGVADSTDEDGNVTEGSGSDTNLQSAANDSLENVSASLLEYQGKMLSEGSTIMTKVQYTWQQKLITDAMANNHSACDDDVANLVALSNIMNSVVSNREVELAFLEDELIPASEDQYFSGLETGETAAYKEAVASNAANVLRNNIISANKSTLNTYRNELEFYIEAKCLRIDNAAAIEFIQTRLEEAGLYETKVKRDSFADSSTDTVEEHIEWLTNKLRELILASGGSETDQLLAEKSDLQNQLMAALDQNDLATAKEIEDQIAAIDQQISDLQVSQSQEMAALNEQLSDLQDQYDEAYEEGNTTLMNQIASDISSTQAKIATAQANMSDGNVASSVADLKEKCLDIIEGSNGEAVSTSDLNSLTGYIDTLGEMLDLDYSVVFPALKEVHQAMVKERDINDNDSFGDQIDAVEAYILDNKAAYDAAMRTELSADDFGGIAQEYLDGLGEDLSDDEKGAVHILALDAYQAETGSDTAAQLGAAQAQSQMNTGNPLVYEAVTDTAMEYVSIKALASYTGMRHVWNKNTNQATLAKGRTYYAFTVYSDAVVRGLTSEDVEYMSTAAKYLTCVHVPEDYTQQSLGVWAVYIPGTNYAVLGSEELQEYAEALFDLFLS